MAKTEAVVARDLGAVGANQVLAHERREARRDLRLVRREGLDCASMEQLAFNRAPLEHRSLARVELVDPSGEERLQGGRHFDC